MNAETTDAAERLYEVLAEEIRANRPDLLDRSFTVAEIYQELVPYRTHRDRIGVEMNGDYEHALLRLLAGEGGHLRLESEAARRRLREELESVRPDTSIYRNFAACEVRMADEGRREAQGPERVGEGSVGAGPRPEDEDPHDRGAEAEPAPEREARSPDAVNAARNGAEDGAFEEARSLFGLSDDAPDVEPVRPPEAEEAEGAEAAATEPPAGNGAEDEEPGPCAWCRELLPARDDLRFCPFCGSRVDLVPCPDCGTELESDWHFCVACGAEVGD